MSEYTTHITLTEICTAVDLPEHTVVELVEHGIVEPEGNKPKEWSFDASMVCIARRATRLHRDLEMDWSAVAMVVELLEEREELLRENEVLKGQLQRFYHEG